MMQQQHQTLKRWRPSGDGPQQRQAWQQAADGRQNPRPHTNRAGQAAQTQREPTPHGETARHTLARLLDA